jgi:hypothetical protein
VWSSNFNEFKLHATQLKDDLSAKGKTDCEAIRKAVKELKLGMRGSGLKNVPSVNLARVSVIYRVKGTANVNLNPYNKVFASGWGVESNQQKK